MEHPELIAALAQTLPLRELYLEVGVQFASTFNYVAPYFKYAIGVDINPAPVLAGAGFYQMSSEQFFATVPPALADLIFIDADHHYESSWRDALSALRWLRPITGLMVLHDTYPTNANELSQAYSGDSWRTAIGLRSAKDLEVLTLPGLHGLTIVRSTPDGQHLHWATNAELAALSAEHP